MSVFDNIRSVEVDKNKGKIFGIKSGIVWGHSTKENCASPLLYLSKPKSISQKDFEELLDKIRIEFIK